MARGNNARDGRTARSELSERLRAQADAIDAKGRQDKVNKEYQAMMAESDGSLLTTYQNTAGFRHYRFSDEQRMELLKKVAGIAPAAGDSGQNKLIKDAEEDIAYIKAEKVAGKIVKRGFDMGDKEETRSGSKPQKLADKLTKLGSRAEDAGRTYFNARDKNSATAKKALEKTKQLIEKQVAGIPMEVRIAIQKLSGHNLGDLATAGFNRIRYDREEGKDWSSIREDSILSRGNRETKSGYVTHKGITYEWESISGSKKVGYSPKQFAVGDYLAIRAGQHKLTNVDPPPRRLIYEGEKLAYEGG